MIGKVRNSRAKMKNQAGRGGEKMKTKVTKRNW